MSTPNRSWRRCTPRGASLVEFVVFIVIVGIALAGVLSVMNLITGHSADPLLRKQSLAVAESMLEEVTLQNFANPSGGFSGAPTQANRPLFDDVSDYNGYATTTGIVTIDGTVLPGLSSYNVSVAVAPATLGPAGSPLPAGEALLITVTVTDPAGGQVVLTGYRAHYGS